MSTHMPGKILQPSKVGGGKAAGILKFAPHTKPPRNFIPLPPYSTSTVHKLRTTHQQTTSPISVCVQHSDISHQPLDSSYPLSKPSSHIFDRTMGGGNVCYDLCNISSLDVFNV
ncbi:hypothetical protein PGT21_010900 [Puccinia graminis f. sp. tritici]|uniref:Uncharacterized protein n=1 Tax=Puccinia graminis f. sp. tritici TaxID=56615 RepID=A0A5B0QN26_PUCGR|nr:hypothetical protein PGT21_010900 [Puccinia graminis f. sp. tritici]